VGVDVIAADRNVLDLSTPQKIAAQLDALAPALIINPAAYTAVDRAEDERELAFTVNGAGPDAIARWAANRGVPLIHFSTDYVFDGSGENPWRENDKAAPINAYGASKLAGEQAVREAGGAHLIVRTSWVYAARGANFLNTIARLVREREELRIVSDQIGAPTSAGLIADAVATILERNSGALPAAFAAANGSVNLAAGGATSWFEFAEAIVSGLQKRNVPTATCKVIPIATSEYPTKARRPHNSRLDLTRLAAVFGITPAPWRDYVELELDRIAGPVAK
jgi:dTDP-4-dehydrorhamnose reductase